MSASTRRQAHDSRRSRKHAERKVKAQKGHPFRSVATMVAATGLFATCALPSYGFDPETTALSGLATDHTQLEISAPAQGLSVAAVRAVEFTRGDYEPAEASEFESRSARRSYNGPVIEDYLLNPRFSAITSANVMRAAAELVGTPYVFGGDSPAGIDCSGYVMFIYSQFGLQLPHSVYQQAKLGRKIKLSEAVPGDIVIFNDHSHNGIYAGNGNFYHAPQRGDRVKLAPIPTERYYIIRLAEYAG